MSINTQTYLAMKTIHQSNQTDINFSLVTKYLIMGIVISVMLFLIFLIVRELSNLVADSMKRITSYTFAMITSGCMLFSIPRLFDPSRKEKEREELFASIREAMKESRQSNTFQNPNR